MLFLYISLYAIYDNSKDTIIVRMRHILAHAYMRLCGPEAGTKDRDK